MRTRGAGIKCYPMRKLSYFVACSLDGYIATTDGRVDWLFHDGDYGYEDFIQGVDTVLMGRNTYDFVLAGGRWHFPGKKGWVFSTSRTSSRLHSGIAVMEPPPSGKAVAGSS